VAEERGKIEKALHKANVTGRFRGEAEKQAAYTLLNRLVLLRLMEASGLRAPPVLSGCWSDDMTLGWVYQYWNDPERERLDAKINDGGKIEPHEIASKTQMFTERYMVDWMLQNSLGLMWFTLCRRTAGRPSVREWHVAALERAPHRVACQAGGG
jgi:hypothetical protein